MAQSRKPAPDAWRKAFACISDAPANGADCPGTDTIWQAVNQQLAVAQRRQVVNHLAVCGRCRESWNIAAVLAEEGGLAVPASDTVTGAAAKANGHWLSRLLIVPPRWASVLAGVGAILLALVWWQADQPPAIAPPESSGMMRGAQQSLAVYGAPDQAVLSVAEPVLRWQVQRADGPLTAMVLPVYHLRFYDAEFKLVLALDELAQSRYRFNAQELALLGDHQPLQWQVEVRMPDGARSQSELYPLTIQH